MNKYLVTGGAGFIGSHLVEALVKRGHFVRVLDNFSSGKEENLKDFIDKIEVVRSDIRDKDLCIKATSGIDFVLHQAALRSVPKSLDNPKEYNEVNINGTLNVLEAARHNKVKSFVFASSSSVYGAVKRFPEKETDLPQPVSPYALTKLAGEHYCKIFAKNYGLNTVSLRYFNVFGPRQALDDQYAVVVPKFITSLLKNQSPPIYDTGQQSRDFTYVENVVEANILAAQNKGISGEVFNVAQGRNRSVLELLDTLNKLLKKDIKPIFLPPRQGDVFKTHADLSQARRLLGFQPKIDFQEGLKRAIDWFSQHYL